MIKRRNVIGGLAATVVAAIVVACSSNGGTVTNTVTVQSPNTTGKYSVTFPSTAAAVATSNLQVLVFDASQDAAVPLCTTLVNKRKSHQDLPTPVLTGSVTDLCDLFKAESLPVDPDGGATGDVALPYGEYAFLAVGQRNGNDFMVGCGTSTFTQESSAVSIPVSPANLTTNPVPSLPTTCDPNTPFTQHCSSDPTTAAKCSP